MVRNAQKKPLRSLTQRLRSTRRVLLSAGSPMNVVVMRPILDVLRADPRIELFFTGDYRQSDGREEIARLARLTGLEEVTSLDEQQAKDLGADLYLCPDGSRYGKRCHSRVLLFHGVSFKGRSIQERARWFHKVFLVGPYQRRRFVKQEIFADDDPRLLEIGMPKLDRLVRGEIDAQAVRRELGCEKEDTCVLYAPTWGDQSSLHTMGEELIEALAARPHTRLVVKFHDHHLNPDRTSVDWARRSREWNWDRVVVYDDLDVVPALAAADVLVTDASSVSQEFCLLDRPILFADVPELFDSERYRRTVDLATWGRQAGKLFRTPAEASRALDAAIADPAAQSEIRRALAADLFYDPGNATDRAVEAVYRELQLSPPE